MYNNRNPPFHLQEKDATAGRGRDGSAGSLDRVRTDRTARGRDRTPGSRGGRSDDVPRSTNPLLEEFKSSKARKIEMKVSKVGQVREGEGGGADEAEGGGQVDGWLTRFC